MIIPERHFRNRKKRVNPETGIQTQIRDWLKANGFMVIRIQQGIGCHPGVADIVAVKKGFTIWIEVKTPKGRLSDDQQKFGCEMIEHGGHYIVPQCLEDLEKYPPLAPYIVTRRLL